MVITRFHCNVTTMAAAAHLGVAAFHPDAEVHESEDEDEDEEEAVVVLPPAEVKVKEDKETNTECVFVQIGANEEKSNSVVKRSQTFSPSAPIKESDYSCKVSVPSLQ